MNQNFNPKTSSVNSNAPRIAFVHAKWHADIVVQCKNGFLAELARQGYGADIVDFFEVPGSFDIPLPANRLAATGKYDAIVAAGFIVDGGIYRHDFVAGTVIDALMKVQLDTSVPVISVVLTPHHFQQHGPHKNFFFQHFASKGKEAAEACLNILENLRLIDRLETEPA